MATLADVNYSLNGDVVVNQPKATNKVAGLVHYKKDSKGNFAYPKSETGWYLFKLVENNKSGGVYIANIDDVKNPETGKVERIRLLSGVSSIWVKDQKDLTPEYIRQNGRSIEFPRGHKILRVHKDDAAMLEFCRLSNSNVGNPDRVKSSRHEFFEYDFAMAEQEGFEREAFELEMALEAKQASVESMRKHASFLGIRLINDIGEKKSDDGLRREYVVYAKRNPQYFKDTKGTPQIEVYWLVRKAISETLIDIGREPGKIFWSNGGGMICVCPPTENAQNYLTELAMTNTPEGIEFKAQLENRVK